MLQERARLLLRLVTGVFLGFLLIPSAGTTAARPSGDEQTLGNLEHDYFRYVESNDLPGYLSLWRPSFLGWPSVNSAPVRKDHTTDWITSQTSKGLTFKLINFKPAAIQITDNLGITCYWVTFKYLDRAGSGEPHTIRITHTWLKDGKDWHIIAGMSMPEDPFPQQ
jgi:hypothetical protein